MIEQYIGGSWTTISTGFDIDYAGGAVIFEEDKVGEQFRASFYRVKNTSRHNSHLSDGTQHAKVARFIIGTSTAGWTAKDCNYLCDGTDDQLEINNAITALPATGGEIVILDGTYNIAAKINVTKDNVSIRGNGNATILKRGWNSASAEGVITLTSVDGCRIESLQIDGNRAVYMSSNNNGIYLNSSINNTITGNTLQQQRHLLGVIY